ncbi:MAG: hypothetical protein WDZ28_00820 [Simkaniaceae bacterium]
MNSVYRDKIINNFISLGFEGSSWLTNLDDKTQRVFVTTFKEEKVLSSSEIKLIDSAILNSYEIIEKPPRILYPKMIQYFKEEFSKAKIEEIKSSIDAMYGPNYLDLLVENYGIYDFWALVEILYKEAFEIGADIPSVRELKDMGGIVDNFTQILKICDQNLFKSMKNSTSSEYSEKLIYSFRKKILTDRGVVEKLNLSNCDIVAVPYVYSQYTNLKELNIEGNPIKTLPRWIKYLDEFTFEEGKYLTRINYKLGENAKIEYEQLDLKNNHSISRILSNLSDELLSDSEVEIESLVASLLSIETSNLPFNEGNPEELVYHLLTPLIFTYLNLEKEFFDLSDEEIESMTRELIMQFDFNEPLDANTFDKKDYMLISAGFHYHYVPILFAKVNGVVLRYVFNSGFGGKEASHVVSKEGDDVCKAANELIDLKNKTSWEEVEHKIYPIDRTSSNYSKLFASTMGKKDQKIGNCVTKGMLASVEMMAAIEKSKNAENLDDFEGAFHEANLLYKTLPIYLSMRLMSEYYKRHIDGDYKSPINHQLDEEAYFKVKGKINKLIESLGGKEYFPPALKEAYLEFIALKRSYNLFTSV